MSLVAYDASSDEESGSENEDNNSLSTVSNKNNELPKTVKSGYISDEDEDYNSNNLVETIPDPVNLLKQHLPFNLPLPKNANETEDTTTNDIANLSIHLKLPTPKISNIHSEIVEEDDEFLHKKVITHLIEKPPPSKKQPVKITIPTLGQFRDYSVENKKGSVGSSTKNSFSLLSMLPEPKHEEVFTSKNSKESTKKPSTSVTSLIPDHVKNRMQNKSIKSNPNISNKESTKTSKSLDNGNNSEDSDSDENEDFFSLNRETKLPEVSETEITDMVEKKVAQMTKASKKIDELMKFAGNTEEDDVSMETNNPAVDNQAIEALVGASNAKRRKLAEDVQIVELSSQQVLPDRSEWMRAALAAETTYQPKGVLVDEEPAPGTRKKHQITYLAHQAKANEAELQAMWAANRQNRRATANKYGF